MIIIADSGSTKTEWLILNGNQKTVLQSIGLNPFFVDTKEITKIVRNTFKSIDISKVKKLFFYGAGCSSQERCNIVAGGLYGVFQNAYIEVHHDMLGAARGLFRKQQGIAIILGTGSNSCIYDGENITENIPALGYILGDEGSGAFFGLQLIKDFLNGEMPKPLYNKFKARYHMEKDFILESVYNKPFPNRFLAQFSFFLSEHITYDYVYNMIYNGFDLFFKRHVIAYPSFRQHAIGNIGSVGYFFNDILLEVCKKYALNLVVNEQSPIKGLIHYHQK